MTAAYELLAGTHGIDQLTAPYTLLVEAFGNDGDNPRDDHKSMAQWVDDAVGWEVYDYKVGKCYEGPSGLARQDITNWHVQATATGFAELRDLLDAAVDRLNAKAVAQVAESIRTVDGDYSKRDDGPGSNIVTLRNGQNLVIALDGDEDQRGNHIILPHAGPRAWVALAGDDGGVTHAFIEPANLRQLAKALNDYVRFLDEQRVGVTES
jgi:hypothetical protein